MGQGAEDYILVVSQMTVWIQEYFEGFLIIARWEMRKRLGRGLHPPGAFLPACLAAKGLRSSGASMCSLGY